MINIPALYQFTYTEDRNLREELPPGVSFCYEDISYPDGRWFIDQRTIDTLISNNINLNQAFLKVFGKPLAEQLALKRVYHYKIYEFLKDSPNLKDLAEDPWRYPYDIDFKTMLKTKLAKKTLPKSFGKPTSVEYYESYDPAIGTYSNLVARVDFTLTYDPMGFISKKEALLRFYKADGSLEMDKSKDIGRSYDPLYDMEYRIKEGVTRRTSVVDNLQLPILGVLKAIYPTTPISDVIKIGRDFLDRYEREFYMFIKASKKDIITSITDAQDAWLDAPFPPAGPGVTVRMYLINELSIST